MKKSGRFKSHDEGRGEKTSKTGQLRHNHEHDHFFAKEIFIGRGGSPKTRPCNEFMARAASDSTPNSTKAIPSFPGTVLTSTKPTNFVNKSVRRALTSVRFSPSPSLPRAGKFSTNKIRFGCTTGIIAAGGGSSGVRTPGKGTGTAASLTRSSSNCASFRAFSAKRFSLRFVRERVDVPPSLGL